MQTKTMIETKIIDSTYHAVWEAISPRVYETSLINVKVAANPYDIGVLAKKAIREQLGRPD